MINKTYIMTNETTASGGQQVDKDFKHIYTFQLDSTEKQSANEGPLFLKKRGLSWNERYEQTGATMIQDPRPLLLPEASELEFPVTVFASPTRRLASRGVSFLFMAPFSYRARMFQLSEGK